VLDGLPPTPTKDINVSFVGTISPDHTQRIAMLEAVAERHDLALFGPTPQGLRSSSPLHHCLRGEVWGDDMYQALRRSRITLNSHIDLVGRDAANMRLFEATGVGAFLLTDFKENLHTLFAPGREVAAWHSVDACLSAIDRYLADHATRTAIAQAGQARTLAQHTYRHRAAEILGFVESLGAAR
jgi:spore maturation protein CgeB